jgi:hypothetical protein
LNSNYVSPAQVKKNVTVLFVVLGVAFLAPAGYLIYTEPSRRHAMEEERAAAMTKWSAWEKWAGQNCTLIGERDVPGRSSFETLLDYSCKDGKVYGIARSQFLAAKICTELDLSACNGVGFPQPPVSWPGAENQTDFLR